MGDRVGRPLEEAFGEHIRLLRTDRLMTQDQLAARSGLSVDSVRRIERGELSPSLATVTKLAHGLQIRLVTLFTAMERPHALDVHQICDLLSHRSQGEVERAHRVLRAMLATSDAGEPPA